MTARLLTALTACALAALLTWPAAAAASADEEVAAAIDREDYGVAAELLRAQLARAPGDATARFTLARVLAWSGDYEAAIAEYGRLLAEHAENVDYLFGRAQALAWAGRDEAALADAAQARTLAPAYEAVWQLEHRLLARGAGSSERLATLREQAARRFPEARWWVAASEPAAAAPGTELSVTAVHETLSRPVPDWRRLDVRLTRDRGANRTVYGTLEREQRFGHSDVAVGAGGTFAPAEPWVAGVDVAAAADVEFMPRIAAAAWAERALPNGWTARFGLRQRRYETAKVTSAAVTAARYFGKFRVAYTLDEARLHGEATSASHRATVNYYHSERLQLDATIAKGTEAEAIAPGRVLRTDVRALSIGARHALGERFELSWFVGSHVQGDLYRRRYAGLSLAAGL